MFERFRRTHIIFQNETYIGWEFPHLPNIPPLLGSVETKPRQAGELILRHSPYLSSSLQPSQSVDIHRIHPRCSHLSLHSLVVCHICFLYLMAGGLQKFVQTVLMVSSDGFASPHASTLPPLSRGQVRMVQAPHLLRSN